MQVAERSGPPPVGNSWAEVQKRYDQARDNLARAVPHPKPEPLPEPLPEPEFQPYRMRTVHMATRRADIITNIKRAVCNEFLLTMAQIEGDRRLDRVAQPRQMAIYLARIFCGTRAPLSYIGKHFGGRDHSTCFFAYQKYRDRRLTDQATDAILTKLEATVRSSIPFDNQRGNAC